MISKVPFGWFRPFVLGTLKPPYAVLMRHSLKASVESYSIKELEPFFGLTREQDLREAIANDGLGVVHQPIVKASGERVVGVEALAR